MEMEANIVSLIEALIGLMVVIATILTAINTARIAESLKQIEQRLDR